MQIGIVSRTDREDAIELDCSIIKYLIENGINLEIDSSLIEKLPTYQSIVSSYINIITIYFFIHYIISSQPRYFNIHQFFL